MVEQCELILKDARLRLTNFSKPVEYLLEKGNPADRLLALTDTTELCIDLVVVGSRGLSGIEEFFLGSVSGKVAERSPIPVLIVK